MKRLSFILVVVGGLLYCSVGRANIIYVQYEDDGDGAITCPTNTWSGDVANLSLDINGGQDVPQFWGPGHIDGTIRTDGSDPTLTLSSAIVNDTTFAWTAYQVNVYLNTNFTLSAQTVTLPPDWNATISQAPTWNGSQYEGQLLFTAGTPVIVGGELDFSYTLSFSGATSYSFTQEMIPVPEPDALAFLVFGVLLLGGTLATSRRRRHS